MKNRIALFVSALTLFLSSCHRPIAYFQRPPRSAATQSIVKKSQVIVEPENTDLDSAYAQPIEIESEEAIGAVATVQNTLSSSTKTAQIERRMQRAKSMLATPGETTDKQPGPKPKKQLRLGNRIRESLGLPLRQELNWWQRISWKLKASVIVILVAVVFAILGLTTLAIIFGLLGAFLLISGLKRSFKVRRPWL
ncbi:hypothetical protein GCM10028805_14210 [Spirosoma harenae]